VEPLEGSQIGDEGEAVRSRQAEAKFVAFVVLQTAGVEPLFERGDGAGVFQLAAVKEPL
jgi:hypothetical protein